MLIYTFFFFLQKRANPLTSLYDPEIDYIIFDYSRRISGNKRRRNYGRSHGQGVQYCRKAILTT